MKLLLATSDGAWCKRGQFWVVGPGDSAYQVGQGQSIEQVAKDWGFLGPGGGLPGEWVDKYIAQAMTAYVHADLLRKLSAKLGV